jgi:hypothetical protein
MSKLVQHFLNDERGATAIEYGPYRCWHFCRNHRRCKWPWYQAEYNIHQRLIAVEVALLPRRKETGFSRNPVSLRADATNGHVTDVIAPRHRR